MGKLGIDFGTSFSTLCVYDEKKKVIVPISEIGRAPNENKIPSVAYYKKTTGKFVYGSAAVGMDPASDGFGDGYDEEGLRQIQLRTIIGVKRMIGKDAVLALPGENDEIKQVPVAEIVKGFFRYFKETAEANYFTPAKETLTQVCVTYPVDFSSEQVDILKSCAEDAGLPDVLMVEEPVAAALSFSEQFATKGTGKNLLIYDLGGGTFDLAFAHEESEGNWKVPFKSGDKKCGGNDFDELIYAELEKRVRAELKKDQFCVSGDRNRKDKSFLNDCRTIKEQLSLPNKDVANVTSVALLTSTIKSGCRPIQNVRMSRGELENVIGDRIQHTIDMVARMTEELHHEGYHVEGLALIGGSSAIPMIRAMLEKKVSIPIMRGFDADIAVARGAIVRMNTRTVESVEVVKEVDTVKPVKPKVEKRKPKGVCEKCKGYYYEGESFCHECGHMFEKIKDLPRSVDVSAVERRLKELVVFDKKFEINPAYAWDETVCRLAEKIDRVKAVLSDKALGFSDQLPNHLCDRLECLLEKCRNSEFHIALVGTIKAGKSTLINAMLGGNYASVSETSETAVLTKFRAAGDDESSRDRLEIKYYTAKEWKGIWDELQKVGRKSPEMVRQFMSGYEALGAESIKDSFLGRSESCKVYKSDADLRLDLQRCTSAKSPEHYFIKEVTVYLKKLKLPPQVVFVDTPGLNDIFEYRSNITRNYISRANAVLVCVDAKAMTKDIHDLILQVFDNAGQDVSKVYIIATHIDDMNHPHEGWARVYEEWKTVLLSTHAYGLDKGHCNMLVRENVIPVSAYKILQLLESRSSDREYQKLVHFAQDNLNYRVEDGHENLVDKIEKFAKVGLLKERLRSRVIDRFESILKEDIRETFGFCAKEVREFMSGVASSNAEILNSAKLGASQIGERIKQQMQQIEELKKQKEKLAQLKLSCAASIESAKSELKGKGAKEV